MGSSTRAERIAKGVAAMFNRAGEDEELSERMAFARTVVEFHFCDDDEETCCTAWLDRTPICAEMGGSDEAEIKVYAAPQVYLQMVAQKKSMAMSIAEGEITYTGPVRKFLRVVPILQSFDFTLLPKDELRAEAKTEEEIEAERVAKLDPDVQDRKRVEAERDAAGEAAQSNGSGGGPRALAVSDLPPPPSSPPSN